MRHDSKTGECEHALKMRMMKAKTIAASEVLFLRKKRGRGRHQNQTEDLNLH